MRITNSTRFSLVLGWIVLLLLGFANVPTSRRNWKKIHYTWIIQNHLKCVLTICFLRMTLEEKLSQMMSRTPADLTRFGIPGYEWSGQSVLLL